MDHQPTGRRQPRSRAGTHKKVEASRKVEQTPSALAGQIQNVFLDEVAITGRNPRRSMEGLEELTASIREHGLLQPLVVRSEGDRFELIAGHRRYEALKQLGWQEAPAIVRAAKQHGLAAMPGFFTPAEAFAMLAAGADALKLFPAEAANPAMLRALLAVLPAGTAVLPVGGIDAANMGAWRAAGAVGFGIGSAIYRPGDSPATVAAKARALVSAGNNH